MFQHKARQIFNYAVIKSKFNVFNDEMHDDYEQPPSHLFTQSAVNFPIKRQTPVRLKTTFNASQVSFEEEKSLDELIKDSVQKVYKTGQESMP